MAIKKPFKVDTSPTGGIWELDGAFYNAGTRMGIYLNQLDPDGLYINTSGTISYALGSNTLVQQDILTPWDITTLVTNVQKLYNSGVGNTDLFMRDSEDRFFILSSVTGNRRVYQFDMSVAGDITTSSLTSSVLLVNIARQALTFSQDGLLLYITNGYNIKVYDLSTSWDITTAVDSGVFKDVTNGHGTGSISSLNIDNTGVRLMVTLNATSDPKDAVIDQWDLSTSFDITSASYSGKTLDYGADSGLKRASTHFKPNGTKVLIRLWDTPLISGSNDALLDYTLPNAS